MPPPTQPQSPLSARVRMFGSSWNFRGDPRATPNRLGDLAAVGGSSCGSERTTLDGDDERGEVAERGPWWSGG